MRDNDRRGGRGGRSRNSNYNRRGGRGGRGRGRGDSRRGGRRNNLREASHSGNKRERISLESGNLVLIDQFMLANKQFIDKMIENIDADTEVKDQIIADYGGCVTALTPGTYRIDRDPFATYICIYPEGDRPELEGLVDSLSDDLGVVYVDTRCLAMIDKELLDDCDLLLKYRERWIAEEEKACRDLLRDNGGAVRYGFSRFGDELEVHADLSSKRVCLWPVGADTSKIGKPEEAKAKDSEDEESSENTESQSSDLKDSSQAQEAASTAA